MTNYTKIAEDIKAHYGENTNMPMTEMQGFICDIGPGELDPHAELSEDQLAEAERWMIAEINNLLPEYAEWNPDTSTITLPIDKRDEFDIDWENITRTAWERFTAREA